MELLTNRITVIIITMQQRCCNGQNSTKIQKNKNKKSAFDLQKNLIESFELIFLRMYRMESADIRDVSLIFLKVFLK
jgi:hypothetical protein